MFAPNDEVDQGTEHDQEDAGRDTTDSVAPIEDLEQGSEVGLSTSRFRNRVSLRSISRSWEILISRQAIPATILLKRQDSI